MSTQYLGVDWASGEWVAVGYAEEGGKATIAVYDKLETLWEKHEDRARRIVVDVPIGLCESLENDDCPCVEDDGKLSRECDDLARKVIGPRSSSVFTAPAREAAQKAARKDSEYEGVNQLNRTLTGKGLMRQAASISKGIVEVEQLLLNGGDSDVIVEGHPEVCFRAFNGEHLQYSKKTAPGVVERLEALENVSEYSNGDWRELTGELKKDTHSVGLDDVLDALALGLTACAGEQELRRLPQNPPPRDRKGLPMQMVYRATSPFDEIERSESS